MPFRHMLKTDDVLRADPQAEQVIVMPIQTDMVELERPVRAQSIDPSRMFAPRFRS